MLRILLAGLLVAGCANVSPSPTSLRQRAEIEREYAQDEVRRQQDEFNAATDNAF